MGTKVLDLVYLYELIKGLWFLHENECMSFPGTSMRFAQVELEHRGSCVQSTFDRFPTPIKNDATLLSSDASYAAPSLPQ